MTSVGNCGAGLRDRDCRAAARRRTSRFYSGPPPLTQVGPTAPSVRRWRLGRGFAHNLTVADFSYDPLLQDAACLDERFVRASGPGGQNVNKVATAVELRFDVRRSSLPAEVQDRLVALSGSRLVSGDVVLIDSREFRTQSQNREAARERLLALIRKAWTAPRKRRPTKPRRAAKEKRLSEKKRRGQVKSTRGQGRSSDD